MTKTAAAAKRWWASVISWAEAEAAFRHEDKILLVLTLIIGAVVGLVVVAFIVVTENLADKLFPPGGTAWRRLVLPVAGALITGFLLRRYFPDARGSGIPQTKTALFIRDGVIRFRTAVGKFFCSSIALASGIPLGREGPSVQVAAGLSSTLGLRLGLSPQRVKALIPIGSAAAVAAAFNTPIAAVLFTLEEVMGDMHAPVLGSIVLSSATAWMVLHLILGDEPLFHVPAYQLVHPLEFALYALLGVAGGLVSVVFVKLLLWQRKYFLRMPASTQWLQPAAGGLLAGVLGWFVPQVLGVGYAFVSQALNGQMALKLMALLVVLKLVSVATCYASGNSGGIFGPSLFMGAMLGGAFGGAAHLLMPDYTASVGAYALVGMGTAFAGIIRVPLTSVIMIFEVTRDYSIIVPLMISNIISYFISSRLQETPIYEALLEQDGIHLPPAARDRKEPLTVGQACRPATEIVHASAPIRQAADRLPPGDTAWPVIDGGRLAGMVTLEQMESALLLGFDHEPVKSLLTASAAGTEPDYAYADDPLDTAMRRMAQHKMKVLPVVSRTDVHELRAVVSLHDILAAYGLEGNRPQAAQPEGYDGRAPVRVLVRTLAVLLFATALAAFGSTYYHSARTRRAERDFADANLLMAKGQYEEAIDKYRSAVSVLHTGEYRQALGLALLKAGHLDEAEIYLTEYLRENPNSAYANLGLARVKGQQGAVDDAVRAYHRAIFGAWPTSDQSQRIEARLEVIELLAKSGRGDQARAEALSLKSVLPADPATRKRVGYLLLSLGMPADAAAVFRELLQNNADDADAEAGLGEAELASNHLLEAQAAFHEAARLQPGSAGYGARARMLDEAVSMDPALAGLNAAERYRRSRHLLEAALAAFEDCLAEKGRADGAANERAAAARAALRRTQRPRSFAEAVRADTNLSATLWNARGTLCGAPGPKYEALARAMADRGSSLTSPR
jgi:CIC family chloride channel protein